MQIPSGVEVAAAAQALVAIRVATILLATARRYSPRTRRALRLLAAGALLTALDVAAGATLVRLLDVRWDGPRPWAEIDRDAGLVAATLVCGGALAITVALAGLVRLPTLAASRGELLRHLLDAFGVAGGFFLVAWVLVADPTRVLDSATPHGCEAVLTGSAFTAVAVMFSIILAYRSPRGPATRVAGQVAISAVALMGLVAGVRFGWAPMATLSTVLLALALLGLGRSATHAAAEPARVPALDAPVEPAAAPASTAEPAPAPASTVERVRMPGGVVGILLPSLAVAAVIYHVTVGGAIEPVGLAAGLAEGAALVARQHLTLRDARRSTAELAEREARMWVLAHTDPLTGLPNRRGLLEELTTRARGGQPYVLLGVDLDGFKSINDMRGHEVGDAVLIEVAHRLRASLRPGDLAARLGGDEFAVFLWARPPEARLIAEQLLLELSRPYEQSAGAVFLSASIGLAECASADSVPSLLRNADLALRYAKQRGKGRVEEYDAQYERKLVRRTTLQHELRSAIDRGELHVAYQPVVALPSARAAGAEALLRWRHPELGPVRPDEFIPVAEESGMIVRLGGFVLHQACWQLSQWLAAGHDLWMSVNVSPYELHSPQYVAQVAEVLHTHRVPPQRLVLEVTEQMVAPDQGEMVRRLTAIRQTGVRIALDDFGAGYNSLGQLRELPVDILKIDHSLVAELDSSRGPSAKPLVDVVAEIGHRLGLEVIAEGVTLREQRDLVVKAGCRFAQGEIYGRAMPARHLEALLAASEPTPVSVSASMPGSAPTSVPAQYMGSVDSTREIRQA